MAECGKGDKISEKSSPAIEKSSMEQIAKASDEAINQEAFTSQNPQFQGNGNNGARERVYDGQIYPVRKDQTAMQRWLQESPWDEPFDVRNREGSNGGPESRG
ncbi:hypothetical protein N7G274_002516 [Stereocaulon virgatum]|uniref:Uncharacterized protein n=1 Tax=Stereocaulon virgatum TaxID=373712 RepID=A0ABR4AGU9_9LECA